MYSFDLKDVCFDWKMIYQYFGIKQVLNGEVKS